MHHNTRKILQISALVIFFALIGTYAFFRSQDLIFGVRIQDVNLSDGQKIEKSVILVSGNARGATELSLNGREIPIDQDGNFHETIALLSGYNIVNITAQDKFGYVDEKNYQLIK